MNPLKSPEIEPAWVILFCAFESLVRLAFFSFLSAFGILKFFPKQTCSLLRRAFQTAIATDQKTGWMLYA